MPGIDDTSSSDDSIDLAAEYVLGTLSDDARQQFELRLQIDAELRLQVRDWQERLYTLNEAIAPVTPPESVWKSIESRLYPNSRPLGNRITRWLGASALWQGVSAVALVAVLILSIQLQVFTPSSVTDVPVNIALLSNERQQAGWLVESVDDNGTMMVRGLNVQSPGVDKSFELWMLPDGGKPPVSLGLLALSGRHTLNLSKQQLNVLKQTRALAVSLEPKGGSPSGLPTGPVLYQGKIFSL